MFTHHLSRLRFLFAALALLSNPFLACTARAQTVADSAATDATLRPTTPRQQAWLDASISQRAQLAEELGEEGARAYAASKGWEPVYDGTTWSMVHGPDQVYRAADGTVHMIEAKGGGSPLGRGYGHAQGSSEWAVESATRVLRSSRATNAERTGAQAVIDAACNGTLEVHVVRTTHVLGEPRCARLEQTVKCSERATAFARDAVARPGVAASRVLDDVAQAADGSARLADDIARTGDDVLRTLDDAARASSRTSMLIARASTVLVPVGIAVDAGLRIKDGIDTEQGFHAGTISRRDRAVAHGRNAVGMVGGMAGAYAGAEAGAAGGAAIGTFFCPGVGTAAGGLIGGLAGGLGGYFAGDAIAAAGAEAAVGAAYTD